MPSYTEENLQELVGPLLTWFEDTSPRLIYEYCRALPENRSELITRLTPLLLSAHRKHRTEHLVTFFNTNAPVVLQESELIRLVANLSLYNAASVCNHFTHLRSDLTLSLKPDVNPESLTSWASQWSNTFLDLQYFFVFPRYETLNLYINSFAIQQFDQEKLTALQEAFRTLLSDLGEAIENNNYQETAVSNALVARIEELLSNLRFLPTPLIENLSKPIIGQSTYKILADLTYASAFILSWEQDKAPEDTEAKRSFALWESLRDDWYTHYLQENNTAAEPHITDTDRKLITWINNLITFSFIEDRTRWPEFINYLTSQPTDVQQALRLRFEAGFRAMPVFQYAFDAIDMDFFFKKLHSLPTRSERTEFIQSLEEKIDPEVWPFSQNAFLFLAQVF